MFGKASAALKIVPLSEAAQRAALAGKNVLVVGGTGGLGRALAQRAASLGAAVTVAGRTFRDAGVRGIAFLPLDAASMKDCVKLGAEIDPVPDVGVARARRSCACRHPLALFPHTAGRRPARPAQVVIFTTGTAPEATRKETADGLETDMAISSLSRLATLRALLPRLRASARVFVWGMPGNGHSEPGHDTHLDDLNATKRKFVGGFGWQHMNTVAVNEALVLHYARAPEAAGKVVVGCNPGLIAHSGGGLRDKVHGGGIFGGIAEGLLGLFFQSAQTYADKMLAAMLAPELSSGALLGPGATPILPARIFADDAAKASAVVADAAALLDQALAGKLAK
jgi:NAD(P)-dependent dehydrogenase (short-subunit alcohol dehydrogenase family)